MVDRVEKESFFVFKRLSSLFSRTRHFRRVACNKYAGVVMMVLRKEEEE